MFLKFYSTGNFRLNLYYLPSYKRILRIYLNTELTVFISFISNKLECLL